MEDNKGFEYAYGWNVFYERILGICSTKDEGPIAHQRAWAWILVLSLFFGIPQTASLLIFWGDLNATIDCLSTSIPVAVIISKMIVLQCHRKVTGSILDKIADDWVRVITKEELEIVLVTAKLGRLISIISVSLTVIMFFAFVAFRLWILLMEKSDPDLDPRLSFGLIHDAYFPFDTKNLKIFVPLWIGQFFGSFLGMITYAGPDSLLSMVILHLCGQLRVIRHSLKFLVTDTTIRDRQKYWRNIAEIVKRHEKLNQLAFTIRDTFSSILLIQMLACSVTFCCQCYGIFTALTDRNGAPIPAFYLAFNLLYAMDTVIHLLAYCYVGDRLFVESTSLADDFYETAWYDLAPTEAKAFLFVSHRSKIPLEVKAGQFCTFNLELFSDIMKTSMGYLSMLMAMKDRLID